MADHFDSFDLAYAEDQRRRAEDQQAREDEDIRHLVESRARAQAAQDQAEADGQQDDAEEQQQEETTQATNVAPSGGFLNDAVYGFVNGIRDAGVNAAQLGLDVATFGQSDTDLDAVVPDVQDRDSTTFALTSGITQFATGFVPALGVMSKLSKVKQIAGALEAVRATKVGRAFTGILARDTAAGAIADFTIFDPQSARFSDFVQETGLKNPVTEFLAAEGNEDDSALVGRLKNVIEGAGLGVAFDGILRGLKAARGNKRAFEHTIEADASPITSYEIKVHHDSVAVERQRLEEMDAALDSAERAARPATDPVVDEARAVASGQADPTTISPDAQAHIDGAELKGVSLDEHGAPFDEAARTASPIEQARTVDPAQAQKAEESAQALVEAMRQERMDIVTRMGRAENDLAALRQREDYLALPPEIRREWEAIDSNLPENPRTRTDVEEARKAAAEANPPASGAVDPGAPGAARSADDSIASPDPIDRNSYELFDVAEDGKVTLNPERMERYRVELNASGSVRKINLGKTLDASDPVISRTLTKLFAAADNDLARVDAKAIGQLMGLNNMNVRRIAGTGGLQQASDELSTFVRKFMGLSSRTVGNDETLALARRMADMEAAQLGDPARAAALVQNYSKAFRDIQDLPVRMTTLRILTESAKGEALRLIRAVKSGAAGNITQADLVFAQQNFVQLQNLRDGFAAVSGRSLQAMNIQAHAVAVPRAIDAAAVIDAAGGSEAILKLAAQMEEALLQGDAAIEKMIHAQRGGFLKMATEYWLNAILSGPITQAVNAFSNTVTMLWAPMEKIVTGAAYAAVTGSDRGLIESGLRNYRGLAEGWRAAFRLSSAGRSSVWEAVAQQLGGKPNAVLSTRLRMAELGDEVGNVWKSFAGDEPWMIPNAKQFDWEEEAAISAGNFKAAVERIPLFRSSVKNMTSDTLGGRIVDWVGNVTRLPSRLLTTGDELAKTLNYHMALNDLAYKQAISAGADNVDEYVRKLVQDVPKHRTFPNLDAESATVYRQLDDSAKDYARHYTFTDPLAPGTFGRSVQNLVTQHPTLRFVVPFVRTPTNLLRFTGERTPLIASRMRAYKEGFRVMGDAFKDTAEFAAMRGRMMIGTGLYTTAGLLAYNGVITGSGPTNTEERTALLATGWQPNSIRITNDDGTTEYVSYNRTDPFGLFLGMSATFAEAVGQMDDQNILDVTMSMGVALSETLQSKAYFSGIVALVSALDHPDRALKNTLEQYAGSFVPNFVGSLNRTGPSPLGRDDVMREADGLLDAVIAKLPGYSKDLPPRRNIFGEVITYAHGFGPDTFSPFMTRTAVDDPVNREIARLVRSAGFGMSMAAYRRISNVELTPQERDRYIQLATGDPSRNGVDLRAGLARLIASAKYQQADDSSDGKQALLLEFFASRRKRGATALRRENRDLDGRIRLAQRQRRAAKVAGAQTQQQSTGSAIDALNALLGSNQ